MRRTDVPSTRAFIPSTLQLAQLLDGFRIKAKQIRLGARTLKGYVSADFTDTSGRYLSGRNTETSSLHRLRRAFLDEAPTGRVVHVSG